jgi:hypothetical protein
MGFAICRFNKDEGCNETGSQEWHINLPDINTDINIPSMWKHYMINHLIQPTAEEKKVIMTADPAKAVGQFIGTRNLEDPKHLMVLYVERTNENQYSHQVGTKADTEFINKLEQILEQVKPLQTKGSDFRPGYR